MFVNYHGLQYVVILEDVALASLAARFALRSKSES